MKLWPRVGCLVFFDSRRRRAAEPHCSVATLAARDSCARRHESLNVLSDKLEHSNSRFDSIRYANRFESIRFVKNRPFDSLVVMQFLH